MAIKNSIQASKILNAADSGLGIRKMLNSADSGLGIRKMLNSVKSGVEYLYSKNKPNRRRNE
ncbi:MAG: hypothetical protein SO434_03785 [Eubacteriales bacterium]|nr:hypothetical protein [Eubacteriales bacterium]